MSLSHPVRTGSRTPLEALLRSGVMASSSQYLQPNKLLCVASALLAEGTWVWGVYAVDAANDFFADSVPRVDPVWVGRRSTPSHRADDMIATLGGESFTGSS